MLTIKKRKYGKNKGLLIAVAVVVVAVVVYFSTQQSKVSKTVDGGEIKWELY